MDCRNDQAAQFLSLNSRWVHTWPKPFDSASAVLRAFQEFWKAVVHRLVPLDLNNA